MHHIGDASTTLATSSAMSGVQEYGPASFKSTDVPHCRHSTRLRAWSSFSPLIFWQDTRCCADT